MKQAVITLQGMDATFHFSLKTILSTKINSFLVESVPEPVADKINRTITEQVSDFFDYVGGEFFTEAKESFSQSQTDNIPFRQFDSVLEYHVPYNDNCFLSSYRDEYYFSGGAHGNTIQSSDTWNLNTGATVPLAWFFKNRTWEHDIIKIITAQANQLQESSPNTLFENYSELIRENFDPKQYYLAPEGIAIYFQQYEIAPYSSGIVTFVIPYSEVPYPPKC